MPAPLVVSAVTKTFGTRTALRDVTFTLTGGVTALLGPNGSGKSTFIHCVGGLLKPDTGTITVAGAPAATTATARSRVGIMLQDGGLPPTARPLPFLRHVARLYREPLDVDRVADQLGITTFASTTMRRLSVGQRQRVALAAAVIGRPQLLFLDEPTAGLDLDGTAAVHAVIAELNTAGVTIVLTTHNLVEANTLADRVIVLNRGEVVADSTPDDLSRRSNTYTTHFTTNTTLDLAQLSPFAVAESTPGRYTLHQRLNHDDLRQLLLLLETQGATLDSLHLNADALQHAVQEMSA